ncbi:DUF6083 domain-containing protein [Streptomyces sp. NPDC048200]|uniref:DUF6083 domain-containing protein n=1 Tax=Streptomyces sp. NPDC048200 TaxID=3365512 RepID=UPI003710B0EF
MGPTGGPVRHRRCPSGVSSAIFVPMRSTPPPSGRHWDGTPVTVRARCSLRAAPHGVTRLLRCGQTDRCRDCGNRFEWYPGTNQRPVRLHPHELPITEVPASCRWHVSSGVAHPAGDGSGWCRLEHTSLCPAHCASSSVPELAELRRRLAINTRRMLDAGAFALPSVPKVNQAMPWGVCRPTRPVVELLYVRYLAASPVDEIQCVAQNRRRCSSALLTNEAPVGAWRLVPVSAAAGQLALPKTVMTVYDLTRLPYAEQLRWRSQRCLLHAATPSVANLAFADWELFDPLIHHEHIHSRLPNRIRHPGPAECGLKVARP